MRPHDRENRRQAEPAGAEDDGLIGLDAMHPARLAERAGDSGESLADLHRVDADGAGAHRLNHQIDRAGVGVPVGEREGNELALRRRQQAHELPGLSGLGDERRLHCHFDDAAGQIDLLEDGLRRLRDVGVAPGALDEVRDFRARERNVADDLARRRLSVAGGENGGRSAAGRVAPGIDAFERGSFANRGRR